MFWRYTSPCRTCAIRGGSIAAAPRAPGRPAAPGSPGKPRRPAAPWGGASWMRCPSVALSRPARTSCSRPKARSSSIRECSSRCARPCAEMGASVRLAAELPCARNGRRAGTALSRRIRPSAARRIAEPDCGAAFSGRRSRRRATESGISPRGRSGCAAWAAARSIRCGVRSIRACRSAAASARSSARPARSAGVWARKLGRAWALASLRSAGSGAPYKGGAARPGARRFCPGAAAPALSPRIRWVSRVRKRIRLSTRRSIRSAASGAGAAARSTPA